MTPSVFSDTLLSIPIRDQALFVFRGGVWNSMCEQEYSNRFNGKKQMYDGFKFNKDQRSWSIQKRKRWYLYYVKGIKTCAVCGKPMSWKSSSLEHVTPVSQGGLSDFSNLSLSHRDCNSRRGSKPLGLLRRVIALEQWYNSPIIKVVKTVKVIKEF